MRSRLDRVHDRVLETYKRWPVACLGVVVDRRFRTLRFWPGEWWL